jgi:hypothetical protein
MNGNLWAATNCQLCDPMRVGGPVPGARQGGGCAMCISRGGEACFRCQALPVTNYEY